MKKIFVVLMMVALLPCCTQTEDVDWFFYGRPWKIANIWEVANGQWRDVLAEYFPYPKSTTLTRLHPVGKRGDGIMKWPGQEVNFKWTKVSSKVLHFSFSYYALSINGIGTPGQFLGGLLDQDFTIIKEKRKQGTLYGVDVLVLRSEATGTEIVLEDN
jgi:hypothetical protein